MPAFARCEELEIWICVVRPSRLGRFATEHLRMRRWCGSMQVTSYCAAYGRQQLPHAEVLRAAEPRSTHGRKSRAFFHNLFRRYDGTSVGRCSEVHPPPTSSNQPASSITVTPC